MLFNHCSLHLETLRVRLCVFSFRILERDPNKVTNDDGLLRLVDLFKLPFLP